MSTFNKILKHFDIKGAVSYTHLDVYKRQGFTPYELVKGKRPPRILEQLFDFPPETNTMNQDIKRIIKPYFFWQPMDQKWIPMYV